MAATLAPYPYQQFFDSNGDPATGYLLFIYDAGTSTKATTYTAADMGGSNTNPIVLNAAGACTIFLDSGSYKFVLAPPTDTDPPTSPVWTRDVVASVPASTVDVDVLGTVGESVLAGECLYISEGDGARTSGSWYKTDADLNYASRDAEEIGFAVNDITSGETGAIRVAGRLTGLSALAVGTPYYISATAGALTSSSSALSYIRKVGIADSSTSLIVVIQKPDLSPILDQAYADSGNVGAGEDTLYTHTLDTGQIDRTGMKVIVIAHGSTANNANAKTIKLRVDDGSNDTVLLTGTPTVSEAGDWAVGGYIVRDSATTGRTMAQMVCGLNPVTRVDIQTTKPTITWTGDVEVRITGEATSNDDIVLEYAETIIVDKVR